MARARIRAAGTHLADAGPVARADRRRSVAVAMRGDMAADHDRVLRAGLLAAADRPPDGHRRKRVHDRNAERAAPARARDRPDDERQALGPDGRARAPRRHSERAGWW